MHWDHQTLHHAEYGSISVGYHNFAPRGSINKPFENCVLLCLLICARFMLNTNNWKLVSVRTSVDLRRRKEQNIRLYQLKVDVGMLNTLKSYFSLVTYGAL